MTTIRRLSKEFESIQADSSNGICVNICDENFLRWKVVLSGPSDTPYEEGNFEMEMNFPDDYPFCPPKIKFITPIYHPNVNQNGDICLDILQNKWTAAVTIKSILLNIITLLAKPNPDNPLVPEIAIMYKDNNEQFKEIARKFTREKACKK